MSYGRFAKIRLSKVEARLKGKNYSRFWLLLIFLAWVTAVSCTTTPPLTPALNEPLTTTRVTATLVQTPTSTGLQTQSPIPIPTGTTLISPTADNTLFIVTPTEISVTPTPIERQQHTIVPIEDVSCPSWNEQWVTEGIPASLDVEWKDDGHSVIYARSDPQWPAHVQFLPYYKSWWRYDVDNRCQQPLPAPQSRVTDAVRLLLGVCPFSSPDPVAHQCLTTLQETPTSNRIVYSSIESGIIDANTWLANIDGSDSIYLESIRGAPEDVMWASNGQWLLIGHYWGVDHSKLYYLVSSDGTFVENLEELTGISHFRVQGPKPAFSPDGQKLAFIGIETGGERLPVEQLDLEEAYNIYVLDLNTMEWKIVSPRFGLFQWSQDGSGLYVLDGAANTVSHTVDLILLGNIQYGDLYYIDLTNEPYPEQKLAADIPLSLPYTCGWAYSPETIAMVGCFAVDGESFGILFLEE